MVAFWVAAVLSPVKVEVVTYEGFAHSYRVSNGAIDVVVVPQLGRIMRIGEIGKRNILWEGPRKAGLPPDGGGWKNWGGDKVWPSPQSAWSWPPEHEYDGDGWAVTPIKDGVKMVSVKPSKKIGVRFEREITLEHDDWVVHVSNRMINGSHKAIKAGVWEICQVDDPAICAIPAGTHWHSLDKNPMPTPFVNQEVSMTRDPVSSWKFGGYSPSGTLMGQVGDYRLSLHADAQGESKAYPDGGCNLELYNNPNPLKYCELEVLDPVVTLEPRASASMKVTFSIEKI